MNTSVILQKNNSSKIKTFTFLQAIFLILVSTLIFMGTGYGIAKYFFWSDEDKLHLAQQLSYYQQLVKKDPENLENKVALGYTHFLNNNSKDAILTLKSVLDVDPDYYDAYLNLGIIYIETNQYNEALAVLDKAVKISPNDYKGYLNLGIVYYKVGNYDKSLEILQKALQVNSGGADILYHQGVALELAGNTELAIEQYSEALKYNPNFEEAREAIKKLQQR